ncbi:hypothetical protein GOB94_08065 [Granulicella sp. 5B5]|uniref:hypothetical protein n=1 Tax=Granulicella sp. 5B5 TaxID=1617967 RepID=UPI0015F59D16|nr:hypothetical protein [Granulicella sp. 5B5]QMV18641.1 hypothetical protein GOB94_08065 [Granulicella sp. 5B5]
MPGCPNHDAASSRHDWDDATRITIALNYLQHSKQEPPMDVHAPHEPVHTWRDFAIHLTIVTIGLFIALSLEALVEHIHNVHLVHEARENIRIELEANHKAAQDDLNLLAKNIQNQQNNIDTIHTLQAHPDAHHLSVNNSMDFESLSDAAWRTARDTGALGFMPYNEVQRYSDLYMLSSLVNQNAIETGKADFLSEVPFEMGIDPSHLPAEEYTHLLHDNAAVKIQLSTLKQFVQQYDAQCLDVLKH